MCDGFSRIDSFSKKKCTERTRLTGTRIYNELSNLQICDGFSRIDSFSKKECTGRTRLMRKGIYTEKTRKSPTAGGAAPTKRAAAESAKRPARTAAAVITAGGT